MMPTFLNPAPAVTILAATGPDTVALIVSRDMAIEIATALDHDQRGAGRGRPAGYDYGRLTLASDIWAALDRLEP